MEGNCWIFGDDINTDEIIPARYLNTTDPEELAAHCMEDADANFVSKAEPGDIIVGGRNFGCGSSREHAPIAIKGFGIQCVVAKSFARIFFRNCINIGLPIAECPEAASEVKEGDVLEIDVEEGRITNTSQGKTYDFRPYPEEIRGIIKAGGLMNFARQLRES
ncbi:MAG: 3-isopropylmalate dehydratase small subunit [Planctomycetes bacterium]|nr:3-isopropylmalate dehydratase small subunit [Planctomycetota bacterium]